MKNNQEDRKIKPISFNLNSEWDCKLLEHVESSGKSFGVYIKSLIEKDMYEVNQINKNNEDIVEAINNIARILESKNFKIESMELMEEPTEAYNIDKEKKSSEEDTESKNIISSILKMGGNK
jgi:hypothetical protein